MMLSLTLPGIGIECLANEFVLPALEFEENGRLFTSSRVYVREFHFEGNTVFSDEKLASVLLNCQNRFLSIEQLEAARRLLTQFFIDSGYINSGAVLPDQNVDNGIVRFEITEGILKDVKVRGNGRLREKRIRKQLQRVAGPPLNIHDLREQLQVLRLNPNIKRINAELKPGVFLGESSLELVVVESHPLNLAIKFDNRRSPSIGAERLIIEAVHHNLLGFSDELNLGYGVTTGDIDDMEFAEAKDFDVFYAFPFNSYDTTLTLTYGRKDFSIIEEPLDVFDIESKSETVGLAIGHPLRKRAGEEFSISLIAEFRRSETFILGDRVSFSPGTDRGRTRIPVIRLVQSWTKRSPSRIVAMRSSFNHGFDAFRATGVRGTTRDAKFFSWLGQFQYIRRIGDSANKVVFTTNMQWTDDELLSLEQFSIGGARSVRGYRENQAVRDRGITVSLEMRLPILLNKRKQELVQIAPFFDYGRAANIKERFTSLTSLGAGILLTPNERLDCRFYWAHPLADVASNGNDLQDKGIHFSIRFRAF